MSDSNFRLNIDNNTLGSLPLDFNLVMQDFSYPHNDFHLAPSHMDPIHYDVYQTSESHESDKHRTYETYSNTSNYDSSKYSPEYPESTDTDEKNSKNSKIPPIIRKGIHKYYEPIVDNELVIKYEDDPNEYKKARKRIQNRESATRVRNRKKNYVEELEAELAIVRRECHDLKVKNAGLLTENNILKQQVTFYEKVASKTDQSTTPSHTENYEDYLLPIDEIKAEPDSLFEEDDFGLEYGKQIVRNPPKQSFLRHMTILSVLSVLMLCTMSPMIVNGVGSAVFPHGAHSVKIATVDAHSMEYTNTTTNRWSLGFVLESIFHNSNHTENLKTVAQFLFGGSYAIYFIYIIVVLIQTKVKRN